jgi:hypothetical protein
MLRPQGRPIFLASPKIEGLICLSLEMLKSVVHYSATDKEGDPRFKGFLDAS